MECTPISTAFEEIFALRRAHERLDFRQPGLDLLPRARCCLKPWIHGVDLALKMFQQDRLIEKLRAVL